MKYYQDTKRKAKW